MMSSEGAFAAWNRRFASRQVILKKEDPKPFKAGRWLGQGGLGSVYETEIEGIAVAWKRTKRHWLTQELTNEVEILGQLSKERHKHIVELIGSYIHHREGNVELGLLLWPAAQCDLAVFMRNMDYLNKWVDRCPGDLDVQLVGASMLTTPISSALGSPTHISGRDQLTWEALIAVTPDLDVFQSSLLRNLLELQYRSMLRLRNCFRCLASAVLYLHSNGIRHKDLKPSQILLTADGLWLADFGWSKDISSLANSATSGGDTMTVRYQAPERVQSKPCGRAEDIFALGCTFLEMYLCALGLIAEECVNPAESKPWSYEKNLPQLQTWVKDLAELDSVVIGCLATRLVPLIVSMLEFSPENRPTIRAIVDILRPCDGEVVFCDCHHAWPAPSTLEVSLPRNATSRREGSHPTPQIRSPRLATGQ